MFFKVIEFKGSSDPKIFEIVRDRNKALLNNARAKVQAGQAGIIDMHGHIFSSACAMPHVSEIRGLSTYLLKLFPILLDKANPFSNKDLLSKAGDYLEIVNNEMERILLDWQGQYSFANGNSFVKKKTITVPLTIDFEEPFPGTPMVSYKQQLVATAEIARKNAGYVLPFVGIDPRRADIDDILETAFSYGYVGGKYYPSLGYLPTHPKAMEIWEVFELFQIPVMVHCSEVGIFALNPRLLIEEREYEGSEFTDRKKYKWFNPSVYNLPGLKSIQWLNDPKHWAKVFERYPKLKVSFSHLGGLRQILKHHAGKKSWTTTILGFMKEYPNVYGDLSFVGSYRKVNHIVHELIKSDGELRKKFLWATDYPLEHLIKQPEGSIVAAFNLYQGYRAELILENPMSFLGLN